MLITEQVPKSFLDLPGILKILSFFFSFLLPPLHGNEFNMGGWVLLIDGWLTELCRSHDASG